MNLLDPRAMEQSFYVSATLSDVEKAYTLMEAIELRHPKMRKAFRWGPVELENYGRQSARELMAVRAASLFIGLLPGRLGTQAELGMALMRAEFLPTRIILWAQSNEVFDGGVEGISTYPNVFWHHPAVERVVGRDYLTNVLDYLKNHPFPRGGTW